MAGMAFYWIALIPLRCSGNQATISLEALVLMTTLVDLMVGSIQLGLVSERGGGGIQFQPSISQSTEAFEPKGIKPAVVLSPLLDPQAYYSLQPTLQSTFEASEASAPVESLNLTPTIASIYRSTAHITFDLISSLYYV